MKALLAVVLVVVCIEAAKADSAYPQLTNINTTGNGSSLQSNANMNSNVAESNTAISANGGNANSNASGNGAGNTTSFDQIRQSPGVFMSAPAATAACQASRGGFLSFIGGAGVAYTETLEECEIREAARVSFGIGQEQMAKEIMCMGKFAKLTASCKGG